MTHSLYLEPHSHSRQGAFAGSRDDTEEGGLHREGTPVSEGG